MKGNRLPGNIGVYLLFGLLFIVVLLLIPRKARFNYEYEKGSQWRYETLTAAFDFPLLKTQSQLLEDKETASDESKYCFKYNYDIMRRSLTEAENLPLPSEDRIRIIKLLSDIYTRGVLDADSVPEDVQVVYLRQDKHYKEVVLDELYTVASAKNTLFESLFYNSASINLDSELENAGVYNLIRSNLSRDEEGEMLIKAYRGKENVSPTEGYVSAGQEIVAKGDVITSEVFQKLESYKAEYGRSVGYSGSVMQLWLGNALFSLLFCILAFLAVLYCYPSLFQNPVKLLYLLFIIGIAVTAALLIGKPRTAYLFMVPFTLFCLYLLPYFPKSLISLLYCLVLLVVPLFVTGGWEVYIIYLIAGMVTIFAFGRISKSWHQFIMAFSVFAFMFTTYLAFRLLEGTLDSISTDHMVFLLIGAFLPVAGYPLIYLMERLFGLVSPFRLEELCDTNNKLLQELSMKAPGTFQHSLAVMNMADAAARSIDADVHLIRAGAMYHDIGKIANPLCFIENETLGAKYHENLTTKQSAAAIMQHVPDGLDLARKYKLPSVVCEFIETHHGQSFTGYFYSKYVNEGGDPGDKSAFTYKGRKPWTKEQAILMLCDSIEAASRTLSDNNPETFDVFVEKMVRAKIDDGQLDDCVLTLKELMTIKAVLKDYLGRLYHARIVYPASK